MKADELTAEVKVLHERTGTLERSLEKLHLANQSLGKEVEEVKMTLSRNEQRLADHIAHVEKWDARRWTTIGFFVAGLVSLVANLVVVLVRK